MVYMNHFGYLSLDDDSGKGSYGLSSTEHRHSQKSTIIIVGVIVLLALESSI
jgi:hypothetical protein